MRYSYSTKNSRTPLVSQKAVRWGASLGGSHHARRDVDDAHVGNLRARRQRQPRAYRRPRRHLDARAARMR